MFPCICCSNIPLSNTAPRNGSDFLCGFYILYITLSRTWNSVPWWSIALTLKYHVYLVISIGVFSYHTHPCIFQQINWILLTIRCLSPKYPGGNRYPSFARALSFPWRHKRPMRPHLTNLIKCPTCYTKREWFFMRILYFVYHPITNMIFYPVMIHCPNLQLLHLSCDFNRSITTHIHAFFNKWIWYS